MYITNVSARGFKRGAFNVALGRATVVTGDNFAGKTQILDAVRLGLIGHLPELGNTTRATFGLASGPRLAVELTFDTGEILSREFWLEGNTVKSLHKVPASLKDCPLLTVMLNAEEYFALGPLDRTRYVFANCPVDLVTRAAITERIAKAAPGYDMEQVFTKIDGDFIDAGLSEGTLTQQEEIEFSLKFIIEHWTNLKRTVEMHQGTVNGITSQRADEDAGVPITALEDKRAALTREIAEITERKGRVIGSFAQMKSDRHRRTEIDRELQHGGKTREQLAAMKERLALLEAEAAKVVPVTRETTAASLKRCSDALRNLEDLKKAAAAATETRIKGERDLAALDGKDSCPYCGAVGEGWKALKAAEVATGIVAAKQMEVDFTAGIETAKTALAEAQLADSNLAAETARQKILADDLAAARSTVARLEPAVEKLTALNTELARLMPDDPQLTATVETIQSELNFKTDEARGLDVLIAKAQQRAGDLVRMATAEKERDAAKTLQLCAAMAGKELKEIQAGMVEGAFRPLLATANAVFAGVLPFELEYREGDIGARAGGVWRGHKTMSGVERALTYCAIQMALAARAPVKVAVLDEMTKLVSKRVPAFATALLLALHEKLIDQVLVIDPERGDLYVADLTKDLSFQVVAVE